MARILNITLLSVALLAAGGNAVAGVTDVVEYRYYDISPKSPDEIPIEMTRRSPLKNDHASTTWNNLKGNSSTHPDWTRTDWEVKWSYQTVGNDSSCAIADVKVSLNIVYTLPRLSQNVVDQNTIEAFSRYSNALRAHDEKHARNGMNAARDIDKAMSRIPVQHDCRRIAALTKRIGKHYIDKYIQKNRLYGNNTRNITTENIKKGATKLIF